MLQMTKNDVYTPLTPLSRTGKSASLPPSKTTAEPEGVGEEQRGEELATAAEDEKSVTVGSKVSSAGAAHAVNGREEENRDTGWWWLWTQWMENGVKEEGEGQGEGAPDSSPQGPPDAVSPTPGLGEDDDDPLLEEGEVDMMAVMVAGGVMEFELLRLPPQSKTVGAWTFQQVLEGGLSLFPYPPDTRGASTTANRQQQLQGGGAGEGQPPQTPGNMTGPPVNITSKLPNDFLFNSEPKVARWDPLHQYWTTNSVLGVDVNMEEAPAFSCQLPSFSPLVLLADRHWNMPYRSWQLSPSGTDSTLLTVNGAHLQVKVEIKDDKCRLLPQPKPVPTEGGEGEGEEPLLNKMVDQWKSTRDLMKSVTVGSKVGSAGAAHAVNGREKEEEEERERQRRASSPARSPPPPRSSSWLTATGTCPTAPGS